MATRSTSPDTEQTQENETFITSQSSIFLEAILAIEIMQEPQSNLEEKLNTSILKGYFPPRTDPSIFTSIAPVFIRLVS